MMDTFYLVISQHGVERLRKGPTKLARGEIQVKITMEIPSQLFVTPVLQASIKVPDSSADVPAISMQVAKALQGVGVDATVTVKDEGSETPSKEE